jgi:hypothetical protein
LMGKAIKKINFGKSMFIRAYKYFPYMYPRTRVSSQGAKSWRDVKINNLNDYWYGYPRPYGMTVPCVAGFPLSNNFTPCNQIIVRRYRANTIPRNLTSWRDLVGELAEGIHRRCYLDLGGICIDLHHHHHHPHPSHCYSKP